MSLPKHLLVLVSLLVMVAPVLAHFGSHNQSILLSPLEVEPGGKILVLGEGFEERESVQIAIWDGSPSASPEIIGKAQTDPEGRFQLIVSIPKNLAGIQIITVDAASGLRATAPLELMEIRESENLWIWIGLGVVVVVGGVLIAWRRRSP